MSNNPSTILPPTAQNNYYHSPVKQPPLTGNQAFGSLPTANPSQFARSAIQNVNVGIVSSYLNPNGFTSSPGPSPTPYAPSPMTRPYLPNNVHNHTSSLNSSRNSSPAMNHSSVSHSPVPQTQYSSHGNLQYQNSSQPTIPMGLIQPPLPNTSQPFRPVGNPQMLSGSRPSNIIPSVSNVSSQPLVSISQSQPNTFPSSQVPPVPQVQPNKIPFASNQNIIDSFQQPQINNPASSAPNLFQSPLGLQSTLNAVGNQPSMQGSSYPSGPSSQPFPNRQINSNMPPLVPIQGSSAANFQNSMSFPPQISSIDLSQQGINLAGQLPPSNVSSIASSQKLQSQMPLSVSGQQFHQQPQTNTVSSIGPTLTYPPMPSHSSSRQNFPLTQPNLPPSNQPSFSPSNQVNLPPSNQANYPLNQANYPPSNQPKFPPSNQPNLPPSNQPNFPPSNQPNFPPSNQSNFPPLNQPNLLSSNQPNFPPSNQPNLPPSNRPNLPPSIQPGFPPPNQPNSHTFPPQSNYGQPQLPPSQQQVGQAGQYSASSQFNGQPALTQQMGRLNVTQSSFGKLWGQETVDLMQCRNILPEDKLDAPPIKLNHQFAQSVNCSPEIFRCTVNKIPETNSLLQKSRLPLGILIHPFKDLNHLPVIQCSSIVRCRACRTYINPFVYFVDLKRWKCNLCYRVNDLPEEFQYDPVTKSYGDPTRRPEIQSATIEYIASSEYMLRPPQPAAYLFMLDVSAAAAESGYLKIFCETLAEKIDCLPGDTRTQLAFICFDSAVHFYFLGEGATRPREMTVIDIEEIFLPSPEDLLVNLSERKTAILELLAALPDRHSSPSPSSTQSALGAALQAAHRLMAPTGGRITVLQTCLPNIGPGALTAREDPNNRSSKDVAHLNPATDFYKRLALDCSGVQVAVDFFLLNSQYADLSTLSGISRFSGGSVYHIPLFKATRDWQARELRHSLTRYLTRKIGLEAVMRVRCTRGIAIHAFHGSFFVRSTDLLSLPNVSPDSGFGMQLSIEENLTDVQHVCFQAALLYTSSKGERRIRVHTLCLPVVNTISDVIHSADQQCIIGLLAKMAVDRSQSSSLSDAREALINVAVDALGAQRLSFGPSSGLIAPMALRLLPLYLLALLKHPAFRTGTSTRLDDRVAAMCSMKSLPLVNLMRAVYPDLYPVHRLADYIRSMPPCEDADAEEVIIPNPPKLHLSAEKVNTTGAYLLDQEDVMLLYIGHAVDPKWLQNALGVDRHSYIDDWHSIPNLQTEENALLNAFIDHLNDDRPQPATLHVITDNAPNRTLFTEKLLDDRVESALSYYEFLQHIKSQMK